MLPIALRLNGDYCQECFNRLSPAHKDALNDEIFYVN